MPYELVQEEVTVSGETLIVSQASNAMELDRSVLISEADAKFESDAGDAKEKYMQYVETLLYPSLIACTKGILPTLDEFLYQIPSSETDRWVECASRLNPGWFAFLKRAQETDEEIDEKKE